MNPNQTPTSLPLCPSMVKAFLVFQVLLVVSIHYMPKVKAGVEQHKGKVANQKSLFEGQKAKHTNRGISALFQCELDLFQCELDQYQCKIDLFQCKIDQYQCEVDLFQCEVDLFQCKIDLFHIEIGEIPKHKTLQFS